MAPRKKESPSLCHPPMTDHNPIDRQNQTSPDLGTCDDCGQDLTRDDIVVEAHWHLYDASDQSAANGWVQYCKDCAPPGIPQPE